MEKRIGLALVKYSGLLALVFVLPLINVAHADIVLYGDASDRTQAVALLNEAGDTNAFFECPNPLPGGIKLLCVSPSPSLPNDAALEINSALGDQERRVIFRLIDDGDLLDPDFPGIYFWWGRANGSTNLKYGGGGLLTNVPRNPGVWFNSILAFQPLYLYEYWDGWEVTESTLLTTVGSNLTVSHEFGHIKMFFEQGVNPLGSEQDRRNDCEGIHQENAARWYFDSSNARRTRHDWTNYCYLLYPASWY